MQTTLTKLTCYHYSCCGLFSNDHNIPQIKAFFLGSFSKSYEFISGSLKQSLLFNGNNNSNNKEFNKYLSLFRYKFKSDKFDISGYTILKNKNAILAMDTGSNPVKNYSENYQSGPSVSYTHLTLPTIYSV